MPSCWSIPSSFKEAKPGAGSTLTITDGPLGGRNPTHKRAKCSRSVPFFSSGIMVADVYVVVSRNTKMTCLHHLRTSAANDTATVSGGFLRCASSRSWEACVMMRMYDMFQRRGRLLEACRGHRSGASWRVVVDASKDDLVLCTKLSQVHLEQCEKR